jgi:AcrR family transcriptional regulator
VTKVRDLDQLLDVAARLFGEQGYESTRLEDIADELGVLKGSLYYYTSSKAELLHRINARRLETLIADAEAVSASHLPADQKLERILRAHLVSIDRYFPESSQWFVQAAQTRARARPKAEDITEARALQHQYARIVSGVIREGQAAGAFRSDLDPTIAALGVLGACNWLTRWYKRGGRLGIDEVAEILVTMQLEGLRPHTPAR